MSEKPRDGVGEQFGQTTPSRNYHSDGQQFTSGAAANPTLTIVFARDPAGGPQSPARAAKEI